MFIVPFCFQWKMNHTLFPYFFPSITFVFMMENEGREETGGRGQDTINCLDFCSGLNLSTHV